MWYNFIMRLLKSFTLILMFIFILTYSPQEPKAVDSSDVAVGVAAAAAAYAVYSTASAITTPSIGGYITWISLCTNPPAINFVTVQAQPPFTGTGAWMFLPGSIPFLYTPPAYPGQAVLGKALLSYIPCLTGPVPTGPGGAAVMFTGTGMI